MKLKHLRLNREIKVSSVVTFMASSREQVEEAYAGDIIGLPNHGNMQIGDSFLKANCAIHRHSLLRTGFFRTARILNPLKIKQLQKGLQQLGEEGAVQVFKPVVSSDLVLGAVGVLQFEVVASRLKNEYGVDAVFEGTSISSARWITCDDKKMLADFERSSAGANIAFDAAGNMAYLATSCESETHTRALAWRHVPRDPRTCGEAGLKRRLATL
jgi:peptide chain release factor 3